MTTNNSINNNIQSATATSLTFNPSTGGIVGTATNDNASAGTVGEYISSSIVSGSAVPITNNTATNVTSISLTAGDWEVYGNVITVPAGSTTTSNLVTWISTTSASIPTVPNGGAYMQLPSFSSPAGQLTAFPTGNTRISLSGPTTVYLGTFITFASSTMGACGFIGARRVR